MCKDYNKQTTPVNFTIFAQNYFMIPYLQVEGLTRYWGEIVLFEDLNFTINQGQKVALIARNGAGKTTLLDTITGRDLPDSGTVTFANNITVSYLHQLPELHENLTVMEEVYTSTNEIVSAVKNYEWAINNGTESDLQHATELMDRLNAWNFEVRIKQILTQLKITHFDKQVKHLSGGQKKRVALANVLINEPDLLILDEPTNHLDLDMIEWLEEYLQKSNCTLFMVTHDRYFLDRICNEILELDQNTLFRYKGNYSYFVEKRAERIEQLKSETDKARNLMRTEQEWMRRMPKARGTKAKYRVDAFEELKQKASQTINEQQLNIDTKASRLGKKVIDIHNLSKSFGALNVLNNFTYKFSRFEKVGIVGQNGTGKSTFLNLITGTLQPDRGTVEIGETVKFGYYRQDGLNFSPDDVVIDVITEIAEYIDMGKGNQWSASQFLNHFLFPYETQHIKVEKLSGGEKRRLYLCSILMQNPNFLILDEPTNDLDIMTLGVLEDYLQNFNGCVIIVSHDRYFLDKIVDHVFAFQENGLIKDFPGNYTIYRQFIDQTQKEIKRENQSDKNAQIKQKPKNQSNKLSFNEKRELEQLTDDIDQLNETLKQLENEINSGSLQYNDLYEKSEKYKELKNVLDEKEMRWLELST